CKQKRVPDGQEANKGDFYTFIAMDSETKLVPVYRVGKRNAALTNSFMRELATRVITRFQLSTDSFAPYRDAVDWAFGTEVDYGQIHKEYRETVEGEKRYSPASIIRVTKKIMAGNPKPRRICTSYIERQNLIVRMQCRRFTRLTNAFSKKLRNHEAAIALHFFWYNFGRIHKTLRVTPAMEAGLTNRLWTWADLLNWKKQAKAA
ncbi:MAG: IS1 family transposase, partial [Bacteroidota bacterium]